MHEAFDREASGNSGNCILVRFSLRPIRNWFKDIGPGIVLAATGVGAGDMVSATIAGANYGLTLLWALAAGVLLKFLVTEGIARWQLATDTTLLEGWHQRLPFFMMLLFVVYFVIWSYIVSSALVAASAMVPAAVFPAVSQPVWGILHVLAAVALVYWGSFERVVDVMKFFIGMMFLSVVVSNALILWSGARWTTPPTGDLSVGYVLSLIGGVGGTVTLLSYGYWMKEQGWAGPGRVRAVHKDLSLSFSLIFLFSACMVFLSSQIEWESEILEEGPRLCLLLADRIGEETGQLGRAIFLAGFWGAAYSSVLGVWHGVPYLFDDLLSLWKKRAPQGTTGVPYRSYVVYMTLAAISTLFLERPVWLVFLYTVTGALFFPLITCTLLWMNNARRWVPDGLRNRLASNAGLSLGLCLFLYLAVRTLF